MTQDSHDNTAIHGLTKALQEKYGISKPLEDILSYEEFTALDKLGIPRYNNLFFHFFDDSDYRVCQIYRNRPYFLRLAEKAPELERMLTERFTKALQERKVHEVRKRSESELYKAYAIMRSYGATDKELFA